MSLDKERMETMPMLVLRGLVCFPDTVIHFDVGRLKSVAALNAAMENDQRIFLVAQQDEQNEDPDPSDIYTTGVVAHVRQIVKLPHDNFRIIAEGEYRADRIGLPIQTEPYYIAHIVNKSTYSVGDPVMERALVRKCREVFDRYCRYVPKIAPDIIAAITNDNNAGHLADFVACNLNLRVSEKQEILSTQFADMRMQMLLQFLNAECQILALEHKIEEKVQQQMDENQKEYYLREQIRAISEELGEGDDPLEESAEYTKAIKELNLHENVSNQLLKETRKLAKMPPGSHEATVIRTYLDTCISLPWNTLTEDNLDLSRARDILNRDHHGLDKVKERIIEALAVRKLSKEMKGQVLCLVGPPGVGKTSIARSIAEAMNRKYVRVSLGGVHDEAEIRGHRRTYVGAMAGRIISAIKQAGTRNPLILLDEIDKMGSDHRGDPASAMLEVLDTEQNSTFRDHYIDMPFDLSEVMFVTTANDASTIPAPLYDRMDVIKLSSYTAAEKLSIAKRHLLKKQIKKHGLMMKQLRVTDGAISQIIECYTAEAGVRTLERQLATLCRKTAALLVDGTAESVSVNTSNLEAYLGPKKYKPDHSKRNNEVGVVNGLAWTAVGGAMMAIEVAVLEGTGKVELTGNLGDVMKESAKTAISYVRSRANDWHIPNEFHKNKDIHIHVPEGAVPKDGPSAGVTMATAIVSALTGIPVRSDVAMTGEISLRGRVMPIGGLREKAMAAYTHHMSTVIIPDDNAPDLSEVDDVVKTNIQFIIAQNLDTVIRTALTADPAEER